MEMYIGIVFAQPKNSWFQFLLHQIILLFQSITLSVELFTGRTIRNVQNKSATEEEKTFFLWAALLRTFLDYF